MIFLFAEQQHEAGAFCIVVGDNYAMFLKMKTRREGTA
jgi:hypothetical protein